MIRRPPRSTRTDTLFPYTTLVRSGTGANVFMVKHGRVTAVEHPDALPGTTRDTLLTLSGADARMVTLAELHDADEIFACRPAAEVAPLAVIARRFLDHHPASEDLAAMCARAVRGAEVAYRGW